MSSKTVSNEEAELYDRQIRLWGLEAQTRMQSCKVLVVGLRGVHTEVCKNLVLAGISVTIQDSTTVTKDDLGGAQFFLGKDDLGKNRAVAAKPKIQELNPFTNVQLITKSISDMTESELCSFQVICMNGGSLADQCRVSKICHDKEIAFYASENSGYYGMIFADLNGHTYVSVKQGGNIDTSKPPVKLACPSLNDFMMSSHAASWGKIHRSLRWGLSDQILAMLVLKMWMSNSTNVDSGDQNKFHQYALQLLHSKGFSDTEDKNLITKTLKLVQTLLSCTNADVTPVCAVLGGFLAQDIVKVVSTHNEPICNIFTFDGTTGEGRITKAMIV